MTDAATQTMSGFEMLTAALQGRLPIGIGETLGFSLVVVEKGRVVFEGTPGRHVYNPIGIVHGGYAATLLDSACGCAAHTMLEAGRSYATLELKVAYHKAMTDETGPVRAEGTVMSIGRRAAFTEARLRDARGVLMASATSTLMIF